MNMKSHAFYRIFSVISSIVLVTFVVFPKIQTAYADALLSASDDLSTVAASTAANHVIKMQLSAGGGGIAAGETINVTFPAGFTMGSVDYTDVDVCHNATSFVTCFGGGTDLTLAASASGTTWGAAVAGQVLTITSGTGTIPASSYLVIKIGTNTTVGGVGTHTITNPTAGSYRVDIAGTNGDSGSATDAIIADDSVDVTATVNAGQSLSFSISDTVIGFGTLSFLSARYATGDAAGSATSTSAHNLIVSSNGTYSVTVKGATLTSGADTVTAMPASAVSAPGTEQFGIYLSPSGGGGTVASGYGTASQFYYAGTASQASQVGSCAAACSSSTTYSVSYLANIASTTESGSYAAALTYVATGTF